MIRRLAGRLRFHRDHRFTQTQMSEYLDGGVPADGRRRIEGHVGACPQCRRLLATLRRTVENLRLLSAEPRPGVADGVVQRLREQP